MDSYTSLLFDPDGCEPALHGFARRCALVRRDVVTYAKAGGATAILLSVVVQIISLLLVRSAKKRGEKISDFVQQQMLQLLLLKFLTATRLTLSLFPSEVKSPVLILVTMASIIVGNFLLTSYFAQAVGLFGKARLDNLPGPVRAATRILLDRRGRIAYLLLSNSTSAAFMFAPFFYPRQADYIHTYLMSIVCATITIGLPLLFLASATLSYFKRWEARFLENRRSLKQSPKQSEKVTRAIREIKISVYTYLVVITGLTVLAALQLVFSKFFAREPVAVYVVAFTSELGMPLVLALSALQMGAKLLRDGRQARFTSAIDDADEPRVMKYEIKTSEMDLSSGKGVIEIDLSNASRLQIIAFQK